MIGMGKVESIKVYGERNTGTNYLEKLIKLNVNIRLMSGTAPAHVKMIEWIMPGVESTRDRYFDRTFSSNLGWKHMKVSPEQLRASVKEEVGFICNVKNPYSWLWSFYKRPHHYEEMARGSFEAFVQEPLIPLGRDNIQKREVTPIDLWNIKNQSYCRLKEERSAITLKFESLLNDPQNAIEMIVAQFDLDGMRVFRNFTKPAKRGSDKNFDYYRSFYLSEKWKKEWTPNMINSVNDRLDSAVMGELGYTYL